MLTMTVDYELGIIYLHAHHLKKDIYLGLHKVM
jgi:hypothetical protein